MKYDNIQKTTASDRIVYFKFEAKRILLNNGNILKLIFGLIVFIAFLTSFSFTYSATIFNTIGVNSITVALEIVFFCLLIIPVFYGVLRMAYSMSIGEATSVSDVLWAFSSVGTLMRVYGVFFFSALNFVLAGIVADLISWIISFSLEFESEMLFASEGKSKFTVILFVIFFVFLSFFMKKLFIMPTVLFTEDKADLPTIVSISNKAVSGHGRELVMFNFSFALWFIASVLSFGVLFIAFTLPFYFLASAVYSNYLLDLSK